MLPKDVSPVEAQACLAAGAVLYDVREHDEWEAAHVANSSLIPLDTVPERIGEIPRDRDVILICRSGRRSGLAQQTLKKHGYDRVANLTGGILAWEEAGLPVVSGT
ncbi:MAG: rhodanese-like domain-containing protein [Candidatus Velthaea sp.]